MNVIGNIPPSALINLLAVCALLGVLTRSALASLLLTLLFWFFLFILNSAEQRQRSVGWIVGTSLCFEAVILALAAWLFCRRDY